ncbi:chaplin family protein [Catenulispora subtropica]|uniref:Chaplin domain-containing protein n=1 Tax=Catenulispora subtropica TaxID=450798 RepID=A0ABP5BV89_9ACTN
MHDVAKRGLALAVATGGLLITGAAPAVSAVHHSEHPDSGESKSQEHHGSSPAAQHAPLTVSGPKVKQYEGRHRASQGRHAAAPHQGSPGHPGRTDRTDRTGRTDRTVGTSRTIRTDGDPRAGAAAAAQAPTPRTAPASAVSGASGAPGGGLLTGNTLQVPVHAPLNVCGLVASVIGGGDTAAGDTCVNGAGAGGGTTSSATAATGGDPGLLNDNVVQVPVSIPGNVCGDTATVIGGGNSAQDILCVNEGPASSSTARARTADAPGFANANVVQVPVDVPVNVCGVTADVVGFHDAAVDNRCRNGSPPPETSAPTAGALTEAATSGSTGLADGNIVQVPIEAPLNVCGDTLNVVGVDNPALGNLCVNHTMGGSVARGVAHGNGGAVSGNVVQLPVNLPAEACGLVVGAVGVHDRAAGNRCANETGGAPTAASSASTAGESGLLTGTVVQGSLDMPLQVCGLPVGVGMVFSSSSGNTCATGRSAVPPPPPSQPRTQPVMPPPTPPAPPQDAAQRLPHTGADVLGLAGIGAGALLVGTGAMVAARRKSRSQA